jgi:WD40 repeat protein
LSPELARRIRPRRVICAGPSAPAGSWAGEVQPTELYAAVISPDLHWAVTTGLYDEHVFVWRTEKGSKHTELTIPGMVTSKIAISPDSQLVAVSARLSRDFDAEKKNTISIWELESGRQLFNIVPDPSALPNSISFSPDGKYLLSASRTSSAILWDLSEAYSKLEKD